MPAFSYSSSWTDISNQALKTLQNKLIDDIADQTALAGYCRQFMGEAVDLSLEETDWSGATALSLLARLTDTPAFGYAYLYQMPTDMSRIVSVGPYPIEFEINGDRLATDSETVELKYIARPADPARLPPHLRNLISSNLAVLLTTPLTSSDSTRAIAMQQHEKDLTIALRAEARTKKEQTVKDDLDFTYYDELR